MGGYALVGRQPNSEVFIMNVGTEIISILAALETAGPFDRLYSL
jgi:hypothetical protein